MLIYFRKILEKYELLEKIQELVDEDAKKLQSDLEQVISLNSKKIIVFTHVPPFREACIHNGEISRDDWLPYFGSKVIDDVLANIANENPNVEFLVLCGHTHNKADYQVNKNLIIEVGKAEYYLPKAQRMISV